MAYQVGGVSFDLSVNLKSFEKQLDKAFSLAKKKGAGVVWDTSSFVAGLKMTKKEFKAFGDEVNKAKSKYEEIIDLQKNLQSSDLWSQIGDEARQAVGEAVSAAKEEAQIYDRTLKHMGRGQKIRGIFEGLKKIFTGMFSLFRQKTAQAGSDFGGFLKRLAGIAGVAVLLRKAFSFIREGMSNLVKSDATTANSVNTLRNALTALKNALASAFAPILNTIAPILAKFIGMLTSAANAVASFISALLGKKFTVVASNVAGGLDGIGSSASGANDSANELKRTLMGFDKINKLDSNSGGGSGGGGGGGAGGGGGGFDLVPVGDEANKWADKFKESWENADFYWLGEMLADKINDALAKIPWDKINTTLEKVAKSIGTFLNGFIENLDWELVGKTIGEGIHSALNFMNTFLETLNWEAVGKAIVDLIAGVNWVRLFKDAVDLVGNVAGAIFDALKGAILEAKDKIKQWIESGKIWSDLFEMGKAVLEVSIKLLGKGGELLKAFFGSIYEIGIALIGSGLQKLKDWLFGTGKTSAEVPLVPKFSLPSGVKDLASMLFSLSPTGSTISFIAKFTEWTKSFKSNEIGGMTAEFSGRQKGKKFDSALSGMIAKFTSVNKKSLTKKQRTINVTAKVTKLDTVKLKGTGVRLVKAEGGVYKNGKWSPIERYAEGGLPNGSQLFWAREKGPELVGTLGGHTAVMNNDQIVASVSSGVAKAIAGIRFKMSAPVLANTSAQKPIAETRDSDNREMVEILMQILKAINSKDFNVSLDGEQIKNNVVQRINNHTRATGQLELIV